MLYNRQPALGYSPITPHLDRSTHPRPSHHLLSKCNYRLSKLHLLTGTIVQHLSLFLAPPNHVLMMIAKTFHSELFRRNRVVPNTSLNK